MLNAYDCAMMSFSRLRYQITQFKLLFVANQALDHYLECNHKTIVVMAKRDMIYKMKTEFSFFYEPFFCTVIANRRLVHYSNTHITIQLFHNILLCCVRTRSQKIWIYRPRFHNHEQYSTHNFLGSIPPIVRTCT